MTRDPDWTKGLDMSVGEGTEVVMVVSTERGRDTRAYYKGTMSTLHLVAHLSPVIIQEGDRITVFPLQIREGK